MKIIYTIPAVLLCAALTLCSCGGHGEETTADMTTAADIAAAADTTVTETDTAVTTAADALLDTTAEAPDVTAATDADTETKAETETEAAGTDTVHTHEYKKEIISEPDCENAGSVKYVCSCGDTYTESTPATGHDFVKSEVVAPTYFAEGYTVYRCSRCGTEEKRDPTPKISDPIELPDVPL